MCTECVQRPQNASSSNPAEYERSTLFWHLPYFRTRLLEFYYNWTGEFKILYEKAKLVMVTFLTTSYICEARFSVYTAIKKKYRNLLMAKLDIRMQLSIIKPEL